MPKGIYYVPEPVNEPLLSYAPGSSERAALEAALKAAKSSKKHIPMFIGGKEVSTKERVDINPPHDHKYVLGSYSKGGKKHVRAAIDASLAAKPEWENMPWEHRASIFLKAADLLAGPYRMRMNAATMLAQSKNAYQAEIDAAAELIDFFRFNAGFMTQIYSDQPESSPGVWNRSEYRALEGFLLAVTPFNFTSIAGNLPCAPAMMGNTVVWKPASTQVYSAWVIMDILREAGLPDGVINMIYTDGATTGDMVFSDPDFAGIHFTGSTGTFNHMWGQIGQNISKYKSYPRIVGETGGKDFVWAHPSSDPDAVAVALSRGAFEFQGQKCSAASRAYIPSNLWEKVKEHLLDDVASFKMGDVEDFGNFINAVIDEKSFNNINGYLKKAKKEKQKILIGGNANKRKGYFVEPTIIQAKDPMYRTMCEEIFGPVLTIYVYPEKQWRKSLDMVDATSQYALTGAIFSQDRYALIEAANRLRNAAGNFYINDKPTGAVVGQQPFGGARGSGTNDKAGSLLNLQRWVSPRTIKETFIPAVDYRYPFHMPEE
ncbi:MAG: 1-pyrroline-5-carboxylate dehydrogenase [Limisphaerales bacterium]|jgi:1-pyrroline-5-carboxylate dehydrogenase